MCHDDGERPPAPPRVTGSAQGAELTLTATDGNRFSAYLATPERPTGSRIVLLPDTHGPGPEPHQADWAFGSHSRELRRDTLLRDVRAAVQHLGDGSGPLFLERRSFDTDNSGSSPIEGPGDGPSAQAS